MEKFVDKNRDRLLPEAKQVAKPVLYFTGLVCRERSER
jgi:hypothetical protein